MVRPVREVEAGVTDRLPDAVLVDRVPHHRMADPVAAPCPRRVAHDDDLGTVELDPRRARGHRRVQVVVAADLVRFGDPLDLAEGVGDTERGRAVGDVHRVEGVLGVDGLAASVGVLDRLEHEQRRLRLDVVDLGRVVDPGVAHRRLDARGHLLDHRRAPDVLGQQHVGHRDPHRQPRLAGVAAGLVGHPREDRRMGADHPVAATRPRHRDPRHLLLGAATPIEQHAAEGLVGEDAREVVDAAVALGLADHRHHVVGSEHAPVDQLGQAGGVGHARDLDLADLEGHRGSSSGTRHGPARARR